MTFRCGVVPNRVSCLWDGTGTSITVTIDLSVPAHEEDFPGSTPGMQIPFNVTALAGFTDVGGNVPTVLGSDDRLIDNE